MDQYLILFFKNNEYYFYLELFMIIKYSSYYLNKSILSNETYKGSKAKAAHA